MLRLVTYTTISISKRMILLNIDIKCSLLILEVPLVHEYKSSSVTTAQRNLSSFIAHFSFYCRPDVFSSYILNKIGVKRLKPLLVRNPFDQKLSYYFRTLLWYCQSILVIAQVSPCHSIAQSTS